MSTQRNCRLNLNFDVIYSLRRARMEQEGEAPQNNSQQPMSSSQPKTAGQRTPRALLRVQQQLDGSGPTPAAPLAETAGGASGATTTTGGSITMGRQSSVRYQAMQRARQSFLSEPRPEESVTPSDSGEEQAKVVQPEPSLNKPKPSATEQNSKNDSNLKPSPRFEDLDLNKDGVIDRAEFETVMRTEKAFNESVINTAITAAQDYLKSISPDKKSKSPIPSPEAKEQTKIQPSALYAESAPRYVAREPQCEVKIPLFSPCRPSQPDPKVKCHRHRLRATRPPSQSLPNQKYPSLHPPHRHQIQLYRPQIQLHRPQIQFPHSQSHLASRK